MNNPMIPPEAVEAAAKKLYQASGLTVWDKEDESTRNFYRRNAKSALEAAAPHMLAADSTEAKLAAVIVALDPFERVTKWMATEDEVGRYALEAIQKIRTILDGTK